MSTYNAAIQPKSSNQAGVTPQPNELIEAEIAINTADGKLFTKNAAGQVITISGGGGSGGAVDSVNGETGAVSLGIQDMDDFVLNNLILSDRTGVWNEEWPPSVQGQVDEFPGLPGRWASQNYVGDTVDLIGTSFLFVASTDSEGTAIDVTDVFADPTNYGIIIVVDGVVQTPVRLTGVREQANGDRIRFDWLTADLSAETYGEIYDHENPIASPGPYYNNLEVYFEPWTDGLVVLQASLAEGDIVQWNDADQKFKPAQLPAVPVDSVNGETGAVELDVEDLGNVSTAAPADGQALLWDNSAGEWVPGDVSVEDAAAVITWEFAASGSSHYSVTGPGFSAVTNDPDLYVMRGQKYILDRTTSGHPMQLEDVSGNVYSEGVTGTQPFQSGSIEWVVPMDAPSQLFYQCTNHPAMRGNIYVIEQGDGEANVQSSWSETDASSDAFIQNKPTLGTAAATDATDYATAAQGALADTAAQPADLAGFITDAGVTKIIAGTNVSVSGDGTGEVTIDATPGTSGVTSINTETGDVVLDAADVGAATAAQGALADTALQPNTKPTLTGLDVEEDKPSIALKDTHVGSFTEDQVIGALDFFSADANGVGPDVARARIRSYSTESTGSAFGLSFMTSSNTGLGEKLRLDQTGRLGVGTKDPQFKLHVMGTATLAGSLNVDNDGDNTVTRTRPINFRFSDDGGTTYNNSAKILARRGTGETGQNAELEFWTNNSKKMTIRSGGFVGINKGVPTERLHVVGNGLFEGKVKSIQTESTDSDDTLVTKKYFEENQSSASRPTEDETSSSLSIDSSENLTFDDVGSAGIFRSVTTSVAALVTFYSSEAARTADIASGRDPVSDAPAPGDGVLLEVLTTGFETINATPGVSYFLEDSTQPMYARVTNKSDGAQEITVTLSAVVLES